MAHNTVQTDRAPAAIGPYSQGMSAGNWLFISGQLGMIPESGIIVDTDFAAQARQAIENLHQVLLAGGCDLTDVVSVDVFLTDLGDFALFNEIYGDFFSDHRPARAVVEVSALPRHADIEIKCTALKSVK